MRYTHEVLVVGGGWAGVSAALAARAKGANVGLCERTDMLLGAGLVGGIMRNNGRFVAAEEAIAMGFGELFRLIDTCSRHKGVDFPGHRHASLYDVLTLEPKVKALCIEKGVALHLGKRINSIRHSGATLASVRSEDGDLFTAEAFVDATGSSGPPGLCRRLGFGCASCIQRCPAFGPRVSITSLMGLPEFMGQRKGGYGAMSGSCKLYKETLSKDLADILDSAGVAVVPLPKHMINASKLESKVCQQYALREYAESLILLDTGHAKLMSPYFPLEDLRQVPGFENARFADPLGGGKGNSIRLTAVSPRDTRLKVSGADNLFVAGERAGVLVGHTEAIVTGALAGRNAALLALGESPVSLPTGLATGDLIAQSGIGADGNPTMPGALGLSSSYTFAGSHFFARMQSLGLYSDDPQVVRGNVRRQGALSMFGT